MADGTVDVGHRTVEGESASVSTSGKHTRVGMEPGPATAFSKSCEGWRELV